jgi:hypothetical protein
VSVCECVCVCVCMSVCVCVCVCVRASKSFLKVECIVAKYCCFEGGACVTQILVANHYNTIREKITYMALNGLFCQALIEMKLIPGPIVIKLFTTIIYECS